MFRHITPTHGFHLLLKLEDGWDSSWGSGRSKDVNCAAKDYISSFTLLSFKSNAEVFPFVVKWSEKDFFFMFYLLILNCQTTNSHKNNDVIVVTTVYLFQWKLTLNLAARVGTKTSKHVRIHREVVLIN
jgi:hypothetical protein